MREERCKHWKTFKEEAGVYSMQHKRLKIYRDTLKGRYTAEAPEGNVGSRVFEINTLLWIDGRISRPLPLDQYHAGKFLSCQARWDRESSPRSIFGYANLPSTVWMSSPLHLLRSCSPITAHSQLHVYRPATYCHCGSPGQVHAKQAGLHLIWSVSSDQKMRCRYSSGSFSCSLAKFNLAVLCCFFSSWTPCVEADFMQRLHTV